jgi:murein DD-endopeptidase MepM/ murein hydrolase activator NlpD
VVGRQEGGCVDSKLKVLIYSKRTLAYKEVKRFGPKVIALGILAGVVAFCTLAVFNHLAGDLLGLGYEQMSILSSENAMLKRQLLDLSRKSTAVQRSVEGLAERGDELRLKVDLPRIEGDRNAPPIGGSVQRPDFASLSQDAGSVLSEARKVMDRLEREVQLQQSSYKEIADKIQYNKGLFAHLPAIKPMHGYCVPNSFGMRIHPVLGVYRMHEGIDILNDVGTPVYATADGVVRFAGRTDGGYGTIVEITHGYGYTTLYAHLSKVLVRSGKTVHRGDVIAQSGRSGLVTGPHLHYEVRYNGVMQNPSDYFFNDIEASQYRTMLAKTK